MTYALDSNSLSYLIQGMQTVRTQLYRAITENHSLIIPPVVYYEVQRGFKRNPAPHKERSFSVLYTQFPIGEMTKAAWECAADTYAACNKKGRPIEDADILIAAFCIVGGYTLVTNNLRHFMHIDGLRFVDWSR